MLGDGIHYSSIMTPPSKHKSSSTAINLLVVRCFVHNVSV